MVASSSAAKSAKTNNRKQTGSLAKTTYFKKRAKEPSAPTQRRPKQVVEERSWANKEMRLEELEKMDVELNETVPMFSQWKAANQMMEDKTTRMRNEIHERRGALQILVAIDELMKQIPCEWKVDGKKFTSFNKAVTWFASQNYGQGSGTNDTNMTAPAAGNKAGHDLRVMFDAPNKYDTISNLSTYLIRKMQAMVPPTIGKEANNKPMDLGIESSCSDIQYTDEFVQNFIANLMTRRKVEWTFQTSKDYQRNWKNVGDSIYHLLLFPFMRS